MKGDRLERQDGFAGFIHRFNFVLEPPRGTGRAELAVGIDQDWYGVCFAVVTPRMLPIKQLLLTFAPRAPIQMTLLAVVTPPPA